MKRTLLFVLLAVVLAAAIWYGVFNHRAPSGQPALAVIHLPTDLATLRTEFNRAADRPRLIVLLSPT